MNIKVSDYIDKQKSPRQHILKKIRSLIQKFAPSAEEAMRYGVPSFKLKGGMVMYAAFKDHIGLYPEPAAILMFDKELKGYETSKGTIKFKLDEPIPYDLIEEIIKYKNQDIYKLQ